MARNQKNQTAFLLEPQLISKGKPAVSLLNIIKINKMPDFKTQVLRKDVVLHELQQYPVPLRDLLMECTVEAIARESRILRNLNQDARIEYEKYQSKELIKYWHKIFENLKPYFPLMKWYYKKEQPQKKAMLTAPCSFSNFKPTLSFEVIKSKNGLQLQTNISLTGNNYPLNTFTRYHFLLADRNEFFIMDYRDYETLERIQKLEISKYSHNPSEFAKRILTKIDKRYPVNRNNNIPIVEIDAAPVCRVLLTELNNKFLMLTPQWVYEGIVADDSINAEKEISRNGMIYSIKRDKEAELEFVKTLEGFHKNFLNQRNGYFYLSFADALKGQWFLKVYQKLLNMDIEIAGMDMLSHFRYSPHAPETNIKVTDEATELLTVKMELSFGDELVPLNQLQKVLVAGQKAVMLKDGSLGILSETWIEKYAPMIMHGKINKNQLQVLRWIAIPSEQENDPLSETIREGWWQKWHQWQQGNTEIFPVPAALCVQLRPYQLKGYEWLLLMQEAGAGACLADDMGLGKSIQTIAATAYFMSKNPDHKCIVICPASLIYNWKEEFKKFAPSINTFVYHGPDRQADCLTDPAISIIITTYSTLRNDVDIIAEHTFGVAVLDESHNIKNPSTQISQAVMRIRARFRIALSGTPVINNTFDLYSQLDFVVPGLFGSREFFRSQYANPIDYKQDKAKIAALQKLTAPFILRRTKEQVATDLPEKTESVLWCNMGVDQRSIYEEILESTRSSIFLEIKNNGFDKSKLSILQAMTRLRQVCSSAQLVELEDVLSCSDSVKLDTLMGELDNILGKHKVIVFSQFTMMLRLIAGECEKKGISFYHFDGQTPPAKRAEMVQSFQEEGNDVPLFLISLKAGNTGLTLTAADYVFLFDPWWNSAVENQAIDRTHRIGQTKNVFAYKLICKDTIEEKILTLQQRKNKLSEELVSADNNFVKSLSVEDVEFLFS